MMSAERLRDQKKEATNTNNANISVPFPIRLDLKSLSLKDVEENLVVTIRNIVLSVKQSESIFLLESHKQVNCTLFRSPEEFINANIEKVTICLQQENGQFKPKHIDSLGAIFGPCSPSYEKLSIVIPSFCQQDDQKVLF